MSRTHDEIRQLLAQKFQRESARLNSWGTKTDEKSAVSFADSVSRFVQALMAESRYRELKRIFKKYDTRLNQHSGQLEKFYAYLQERLKATKAMAKALENFAVKAEGEKAWKPKKHKHHHHYHRSKR